MVTGVTAAASLMSAARMLMLEKGAITVENVVSPIKFLYNPASYNVKKSTQWTANGSSDGDNAERYTFKSVKSSTVTFTLFFDTYEYGSDVRYYTDQLFNLVKVDPKTKKTPTDKARPPLCKFHWGYDSGGNSEFWAFVSDVNVSYTLFLMSGTPVRAEAALTLTEVSAGNGGQNPTTQGTYGDKIHIVKPGETLSLISHMYYGSSTEWRVLADANSLTNPLDIWPGQYLEIVPLEY